MDSVRIMGDFMTIIRHFFSRPDVLWQLLPLLIYPILWFLLRFLWNYPDKALRRFLLRRLPKRTRGTIRRILFILRRTFSPLVSLLVLYLLRFMYVQAERVSGLLDEFIIVAWILFAYRFVVAILYAYLPDRAVKHYHRRLLTPLFILFALGWLLRTLISPLEFLNLPVLRFFQTSFTVGSLLIPTLGLYLWIMATLALEAILRTAFSRRRLIDKGSLEAGLTLGRYALVIVGISIALRSAGLNQTTVGFITGGLSVGIGIGLQGVISNFVSGLILLFERSIRPGDVVDVGGTIGTVRKLSIRSTEVRVGNGKDIIIPNNTLLTSNVVTYTRNDRTVLVDVAVTITKGDDLKRAMEVLLGIAREHSKVLRNPPPNVTVTSISDSNIKLSLNVWVADLNFGVKNDLYVKVWEAFREEKIAF
ncbi:MAG: mechanosensitive ion channel family protein [Trueperaceae bacterium]